jgi:hypothetical protein
MMLNHFFKRKRVFWSLCKGKRKDIIIYMLPINSNYENKFFDMSDNGAFNRYSQSVYRFEILMH